MKLRCPKLRPGFSIIELMVYVVIVAVAMTVFANFAIAVTQNASQLKNKHAVEQNAELLLARISEEIRYSQNVVSASGSTLTLTNSSGSQVTITLNGTEVDYNGVALSNSYVSVRTLTFSSITGMSGGVAITLTVQPKNSGGIGAPYTLTLTSTAVSRHQQVYS